MKLIVYNVDCISALHSLRMAHSQQILRLINYAGYKFHNGGPGEEKKSITSMIAAVVDMYLLFRSHPNSKGRIEIGQLPSQLP